MAKLSVGDKVTVKLGGKARKAEVLQVPTDEVGAVLVGTVEGSPYLSTYVSYDEVSKSRGGSKPDDSPPPSDPPSDPPPGS